MVKQKDFITLEVSGSTNSSPDTASRFRHNKNQVPWLSIVVEGNVYIPRNGTSANDIDVRSPNASEAFKVLLFFN